MKIKIFFIFLMGILFIPNFVLAVNQNTHSIDFESSSSQYAFITDENQTGLDITGDISMEAWVKFETTGKNQVIMGKWGPNIRQYIITTLSTNKLRAIFSDNGTENAGHLVNFTTNDAVITDTDVWYHIAVTFDISEETCIIYINGESVDNTKSGSIGATLYSGSADFKIGQQNNAEYLDGLIDDVRVWNDVRTPEEITDNYKKELVGDETGLVGYWKFNNNALDTTSNDNDLTIANSPSYSSDYAFEYDPNPDPDPTPTTTPTIATEDAHIMNTILLILGFVLTLDLLRRIFMPLDKKRGL